MAQSRELLELTAALAADYLESLPSRPVFPKVQPDELRAALGGPLQDGPLDATQVISELAGAADRGIVASGSGRYFGFVIGGTLPSAMAADWLASAWDQTPACTHAVRRRLSSRRSPGSGYSISSGFPPAPPWASSREPRWPMSRAWRLPGCMSSSRWAGT